MKITKISKQKNRSDKYSVFVDEKFAFGITASNLIKEKLATGDEISEKRLEELKEKSAYTTLLDNTLNFLAPRPHSTLEVQQYLKKRIYKKNSLRKLEKKQKERISQKVLDYLKKHNYLNDPEFAAWFVSQRSGSRPFKGRSFIFKELLRKGIGYELAQKLTSQISEDLELEKATLLAKKKNKSRNIQKKDEFEAKQQIIKFLYSKGYPIDICRRAVDTVTSAT